MISAVRAVTLTRRNRWLASVVPVVLASVSFLNIAPAKAASDAADLSVSVAAAPSAVQTGSNVTLTTTVINAGPSAARKARAAQPVPLGTTFVRVQASQGTCTGPDAKQIVVCQLGRLETGGRATVNLVVRTTTPGGSVLGLGRAQSETEDPNRANNAADVTVHVTRLQANLAVQVTPSTTAGDVAADEELRYTINVTNGGPSTATKAEVVDLLPRGAVFSSIDTTQTTSGVKCATPPQGVTGRVSCNLPPLKANEAVAFTVVTTVKATSGVLTNTALVQSPAGDPDPRDNYASSTVLVSGTDPASLRKTDVGVAVLRRPYVARPGAELTYVAAFGNVGPDVAPAPLFTLTVGPGTTFASLTADRATCDAPPVGGRGLIVCTTGGLHASQSAVVVVTVKVTASVNSVILGNATVTQGPQGADSVPGNNVQLWTVPVLDDPQMVPADQEQRVNDALGSTDTDAGQPSDLSRVNLTVIPGDPGIRRALQYDVNVENLNNPDGWSTPVDIVLSSGTAVVASSVDSPAGSCAELRTLPDGSQAMRCQSGPLARGSNTRVVTLDVELPTARETVYTALSGRDQFCPRGKVKNEYFKVAEDTWLGECRTVGFRAVAIVSTPFDPGDAIDSDNIAQLIPTPALAGMIQEGYWESPFVRTFYQGQNLIQDLTTFALEVIAVDALDARSPNPSLVRINDDDFPWDATVCSSVWNSDAVSGYCGGGPLIQ